GSNYNLVSRQAMPRSVNWETIAEVKDGNAGFLTRIAELVADNTDQEDLCHTLIYQLDQFSRFYWVRKDGPPKADVLGAFANLKKAYDKNPSQRTQYNIEIVSQRAEPEVYAALKSKCGPVVSILRPFGK